MPPTSHRADVCDCQMPVYPPSIECCGLPLGWNGRCPECVIWGIMPPCAKCAVLSFVEECRRARVASVFLLLASLLESYFFERKEPDSVRPELGRCARPGFASFQVLTRTLRKSYSQYFDPQKASFLTEDV
jgi:hypothetical protein